MNNVKVAALALLAAQALVVSGCVGHTHTERVVERDAAPASSTTVVR